MSNIPAGCKLVLDPRDDFNHEPDDVSNYNESMYFSIFDSDQGLGGWCRIGNRVNEGHAEMTTCLYLPDGRVAFMWARPAISSNEEMNAGGLHFRVEEPFERIVVSYAGKVCLLADPTQMSNPRDAFKNNPIAKCSFEVTFDKASPVTGGQLVKEDGSALSLDPEKSFLKAHYEQFMAGQGAIEIDGQTWHVSGHGMRDKSWGPRYWQSIAWYRWIHVRIGPDFAVGLTVSSNGERVRSGGAVFREDAVHEVEECSVETEWDENGYHRELVVRGRTKEESFELSGRVVSLIPLRNRRRTEDGSTLHTRIVEGMTEYTFLGRKALGMAEYLDQIVDGEPLGRREGM